MGAWQQGGISHRQGGGRPSGRDERKGRQRAALERSEVKGIVSRGEEKRKGGGVTTRRGGGRRQAQVRRMVIFCRTPPGTRVCMSGLSLLRDNIKSIFIFGRPLVVLEATRRAVQIGRQSERLGRQSGLVSYGVPAAISG